MTQIQAQLLSIGIEAAVAAALAAWLIAPRAAVRASLAAALATLLTHPLAWWSFLTLYRVLTPLQSAAIVEPLVVLAESVAYRFGMPCRWPLALALSTAANAASWGAGVLIYALR